MKPKKISVTILAISLLPLLALAQQDQVVQTLQNALNWLKGFALVLASIAIVLAAYYFVTAGGDEGKIKQGRHMILWAIVGFLVVLLSQIFIGIVCKWVPGASCP